MSEQLIRAMQDPSLYDHPVEKFEVLQTHISWVILTGPYAYKIKKPMNFGFLDFTSLEKRQHFCEQELRLNRRLAPELYLEVIPVCGSEAEPRLDGANPVIEFALKMRQFPQQNLLSRVESEGQLNRDHIDALAEIIAHFHTSIPAAPEGSDWGTPEQVMAPVRQNFEQIRPLLENADDLAQLEQLEGWAECTFERLEPNLRMRRSNHHIRECHGDLHLGNITQLDGELCLFDCIEFNEEFKWIDTISDIGFLIMDLEDRGHFALAARLLNRYLEITGDYPALSLLNFYKSYRAMVRAKVGLFRLGQEGLPESEREAVLDQYRSYAQLAERYTAIPQPYLLTMHGVSGTGKSTVSATLVEQLGLIRIRSDIERKRIHGMDELDRSDSGVNAGIYTAGATGDTYDRLAVLAVSVLLCGFPVVVDASFLNRDLRNRFHRLAEDLGVAHLIVDCITDPDFAREWVQKRAAEGKDPSEAGAEVLERQLQTRDALSEEEMRYTWAVEPLKEVSTDHLCRRLSKVLSQGTDPAA